MSRVTEVQTDAGSYEQFSVNCGQRSEPRYIRKPSDSNQWCDAIVGTFCARQRLKVASQVCSRRYTAAINNLEGQSINSNDVATSPPSVLETDKVDVAQNQPAPISSSDVAPEQASASTETQLNASSRAAPGASKTELESELRDIEQQLLDLQAKKLELRAKDLELMKQQIEPGQ